MNKKNIDIRPEKYEHFILGYFVDCICEILDMERPSFVIDNKNVLNDVSGQTVIDEDGIAKIYIKDPYDIKGKNNVMQFCFVIAHELRHCWQSKNGVKFDNYRNDIEITEYRKQPEEIDANAFAYLVMHHFFDCTPSKKMYPNGVYELMMKRVDEIYAEFVEGVLNVYFSDFGTCIRD